MSAPTISPEAFAALVKSRGLPVEAGDMDELRQAYGAILRVRQRLQSMPTDDLTPAPTFRPLNELEADWPDDVG